MTLTFLDSKKLICCNAQHDGDFALLSSRYRADELICKAIGNLQMQLRTMTELVMAKNFSNNSLTAFSPSFMDDYADFINDFSSDLAGIVNLPAGSNAPVIGLINGLTAAAKKFTSDNVTPL